MAGEFADARARLLTSSGQLEKLLDLPQRDSKALGPAKEAKRRDRVVVIHAIPVGKAL